jgi:prepilin-type N-terminal cleavage/methylation domain-containing protein
VILKKFKNKKASPGFTLIEVALAILLLATALTIIVSLQSAVVEQSISNSEREEALLYARSILSSYEIAENLIPKAQSKISLYTYLKDSNLLPTQDRYLEDHLKNYTIDIEVEPWKIPGFEELNLGRDGLTRITTRIIWGDGIAQQAAIDYFVPIPDLVDDEG